MERYTPTGSVASLCAALLLGAALALGLAASASAQNGVLFSPDITAPLGAGPAPIADDDAATDDAAGGVTPVLLTMLGAAVPANVEVAGLELSSDAPAALALDISAPLPGLPLISPAVPQDVLSWDPNTDTYSLTFDGSANSVPANARIDAVSRNPAGDLLLSFDITLTLPGVGTVDDEDLVEFSVGTFSMEFDGSAAGIAMGLDLDAASRETETSTNLLLSFDGSGITPGGQYFDDEDTLEYDPSLSTFAMWADASTSDPTDWPSADLVALPEPGFGASLAACATALALLSRRHGARRSRSAPRPARGDLGSLLAAIWITMPLLATAPAGAVDGVIEINDASVQAAGGYPAVINAAGSYRLTGNLTAPFGSSGIQVFANDVTVDLNGFRISGPGGSGNGVAGLGSGLTVRNGTISGFVIGIIAGPGSKVIQMRVTGTTAAITNGSDCLVLQNTVTGNGTGVQVSDCKIEDNIIENNSNAIVGGDNLIVRNRIASNGAGGIQLSGGGTIQENVITDNGNYGISDLMFAPPPAPPPAGPPHRILIVGNTIQGTFFGPGISVMLPALIASNVISFNSSDGVVCGVSCTVQSNVVESNNIIAAFASGGVSVGDGSNVTQNSISYNGNYGLSLPVTAGYSQNTFSANGGGVVDVASPPHPTAGFMNLCSGVPGPALTCP